MCIWGATIHRVNLESEREPFEFLLIKRAIEYHLVAECLTHGNNKNVDSERCEKGERSSISKSIPHETITPTTRVCEAGQ